VAQGTLGATGVRRVRVGYGLEVGRSVRTAGRAGAYCVVTWTAYFISDCTAVLVRIHDCFLHLYSINTCW